MTAKSPPLPIVIMPSVVTSEMPTAAPVPSRRVVRSATPVASVLGTSVTRRVFLQNRTPSFLVVRDFTILGTDRQSFAEDDTSGWYLMWPNDTVTVRVTFKATSLGSKSAELRLPVDTNIVRRVQLTGKVTAP